MVVSSSVSLSRSEVTDILHVFDNEFTPALSLELSIDDYARKLSERAKFLTAYSGGGQIIGFVAFYINHVESMAYIPLIGVLPDYQHLGIGKQMLDALKQYCCDKNINKIMLEVYKNNTKAYWFYVKNGFIETEDRGEKLLMRLQLVHNKIDSIPND